MDDVEAPARASWGPTLATAVVFIIPLAAGGMALADRDRHQPWWRATLQAARRGRWLQAAVALFVLFMALFWVNWLVYEVGIGFHERRHRMTPHIPTVPPWRGYGTLVVGLLVDAAIATIGAKLALRHYVRSRQLVAAGVFD